MRKGKTWTDGGAVLRVPRAKSYGKGFTCMGAIGTPLKNNCLFKMAKSTNAVEMLAFVEDLIGAKREPNSRPALVLDGASSHRNR